MRTHDKTTGLMIEAIYDSGTFKGFSAGVSGDDWWDGFKPLDKVFTKDQIHLAQLVMFAYLNELLQAIEANKEEIRT